MKEYFTSLENEKERMKMAFPFELEKVMSQESL